MRAVAVIVCACALLVPELARADSIDDQRRLLKSGETYKVRLGAALALSRSPDARAVTALSSALTSDRDPSIRRICAIGLGKTVDPSTPADARNLALLALNEATRTDKDSKVRESAAKSLASLAGLRSLGKSASGMSAPSVFVNVDPAVDVSKRAAPATNALTRVVRGTVKGKGYAVDWPGGAPTERELSASGARGFIVGATVKNVSITPRGSQTEVTCTVMIRIAPWNGKDANETWEANRAASASGSAKAVTGAGDRAVAGGIQDCVLAVGEEITSRQVVPFLKRLAGS